MSGASGDEQLVVRDLPTLKALADPVRHAILTLVAAPRTVKELSAHIGRPPDRLYYHLGLLEKHGLVRAIDERGAERRYVVAAREIEIDPALTVPKTTARDLVTNLLDRIRDEYLVAIRRAGPATKRKTRLGVTHVHLSEEERAELAERLEHVTDRYVKAARRRRAKGSSDDRQVYGVVVGMWPVHDAGADE